MRYLVEVSNLAKLAMSHLDHSMVTLVGDGGGSQHPTAFILTVTVILDKQTLGSRSCLTP